MNRQLFLLLIFVFTHIASAHANDAQFSLSVDRTIVEEGKSLELRFRYSGETNGLSPDFSAISNNFDILSISPSSQRYNINGKRSVVNEWLIYAIPKRKGNLLIPPITFEDKSTEATNIEVREKGATSQSQDVFIETIVNKSAAYIGEQIKLSYRLYYDVNIDNPQADPLNINSVDIQEMPTQQFRRRVDGRLYNVAEFNYLLTASNDGTIVIPSLNWRIRINVGGGQSLFDRFGRYEVEQHRSQEKIVRIKPIPDSYPKDTPWLPAKSFEISQSWSQDKNQMAVGVPNTRKIEITAEGLRSAALPALQSDYSDSELKIYAESPELNDEYNGNGTLASSIQNAAFLINQSGELTIPEIRVAWWNTETDKLEYASVEEQRLSVASQNSSTVDRATSQENNRFDNQAPVSSSPNKAEQNDDTQSTLSESPSSTKASWLVYLLIATNVLTLLICILLLLKILSLKKAPSKTSTLNNASEQLNTLLKQISDAERQALWKEAYELTVQLASSSIEIDDRHTLSFGNYRNLCHEAEITEHQSLAHSLKLLERSLFSASNETFSPSTSVHGDLKQFLKSYKNKHTAEDFPRAM